MNHKMIVLLSATIAAIVSVVFLMINILTPDGFQPTASTLTFCEDYPEALICETPEAPVEDVMLDMFNTLKDQYSSGYDETFCDMYFYGNVRDYCKSDTIDFFPIGFHLLSDDYIITEINEGIYDLETTFSSGNPAYIIRVAVIVSDGLYQISGFSFYDVPPIADLALTDNDINTFMVTMIEADETDAEFCNTYFTEDALEMCETDTANVTVLDTYVYHYNIINVTTNDYYYMISNQEQTTTYQYHIVFTEVDDVVKISELEVELLD